MNAHDIIVSPLITEKSTTATSLNNQVVFLVSKDATKTGIKKAVKALFGVEAKAINTMNRKGKTKRFRGRLGKQNDKKIAFVTLAEGQSIDVSTGL